MAFIDSVLSKPITASALYNSVAMHLSRRAQTPILRPDQLDLPHSQRITGVRVLVVDDSDINREVAKEILEADGAIVFLANDGQEALDWLAANEHLVDIILMDVQMPGMDGYVATKLIRQKPQWQSLPIIALTAGAFNELADAAREAGMNDFVSKPFNVDYLMNVIRHFTIGDTDENNRSVSGGLGTNITSVAQSSFANEDALTLPGIDFADALDRWRDRGVYQKYLSKFVESYANAGQTIIDGIRDGDIAIAAALVHKLTGTAGILALKQVALKAREVGELLTNEDRSAAVDASAGLQAAISETCNSIAILNKNDTRIAESGPENLAIKDKNEVVRLICQLLEALEQHDLELAEKQLQELVLKLPLPQLDHIRSGLDDFDFNKAIALSKELLIQISSS